jgi:hypothetical protein
MVEQLSYADARARQLLDTKVSPSLRLRILTRARTAHSYIWGIYDS